MSPKVFVYEYEIYEAEIRDNELWCAVVEDPSDWEDWFVFDFEELEDIDPQEVVEHPEKFIIKATNLAGNVSGKIEKVA